jgi:hypothetical protein
MQVFGPGLRQTTKNSEPFYGLGNPVFLICFWMEVRPMDSRAQVSIELIIIVAAVVALVLLMVSQLKDTATQAKAKIVSKSNTLFDEIDHT